MDSVPIVAITANVAVPLLRQDSFQEIDIASYNADYKNIISLCKPKLNLAPVIRRALKLQNQDVLDLFLWI